MVASRSASSAPAAVPTCAPSRSVLSAAPWVPLAAAAALRAISRVAALCSSTAAAMAEVTSSIRPTAWAMPRTVCTACPVAERMAPIWVPISSVALAV
ncbi:hypothetical protein [Teichococcus aestuarii]|uniref:hypothetical protein n=1 Tax=Teichococcus aestuarii TaxID=568898 RepID=UPI00361B0811